MAGFVKYAAQRFYNDNCLQAAASLTYTVLLALVPLTAIIVAIYTAFPAFTEFQEQARALIVDNFVPQVGQTVADSLESFASNAGGLTAMGVIGLVVTSILMLSTIESSFNAIWHVNESRSWLVRLLTFWAVLTLTPLLFGASLSLGTRLLQETAVAGGPWAIDVFGMVVPIVFQIMGFSLLYWIIPNRSVQWRDAAAGGIVAGLAFELAKRLFVLYLNEFPVYQTLYGALATIPIFLVWLYLVWSIALFGAVVAASLPDWRSGKVLGGRPDTLLPGPRLTIALALLKELEEAAKRGIGVRIEHLTKRVPVGSAAVESGLTQLRHARFVQRTSDDRWMISRDPNTATVEDLMHALGIGLRGPVGKLRAAEGAWQDTLAERAAAAEQASHEPLDITLADLFASGHDDGKVTQLRSGPGS